MVFPKNNRNADRENFSQTDYCMHRKYKDKSSVHYSCQRRFDRLFPCLTLYMLRLSPSGICGVIFLLIRVNIDDPYSLGFTKINNQRCCVTTSSLARLIRQRLPEESMHDIVYWNPQMRQTMFISLPGKQIEHIEIFSVLCIY